MGCGSINTQKLQQPSPNLSLNRVYQRLQAIGKGIFGTVYLCRNNLNGLLYALKVIEVTARNKQEAIKQVQNLKRQIGVLKKLKHKNIVKYYSFDISPDGKQVQIVLEYAQRGSLKQYVKQKGKLTQAESAAFTQQIINGLVYLHSQKIVHRDLKCANILIMADGTLKITDFGTAKHIQEQDLSNIDTNPSLKGTPYYMAPQILRRKGHSIPVDVWSLGCLVIEMLTGRTPWTSLTQDFQQIIGYIVSGIHPPFPKKLSGQCEQFLNACLNSLPCERKTSRQLANHFWITGNKIKGNTAGKQRDEGVVQYKNSLQKTDDGVDQIQGKARIREEKLRQIESYMGQKSRERQTKKQGDRQSAKNTKRGKSGNILISHTNNSYNQDIQVLECQPVSRKLFVDEVNSSLKQKQKSDKIPHTKINAETAPHMKVPQDLIIEIKSDKMQQFPVFEDEDELRNNFLAGKENNKRLGQNMIDTAISRQQRARYLQQQRLLRQQRQEERNKWQQQLREGASYLKKQINSRYIIQK